MNNGVIQGFFPNGVARIAAASAGARPNAGAVPLPPAVDPSVRSGPGTPLPAAVRQRMESFFGANFADVRIHAGSHAKDIGALAFTRGNHIHFAAGQYDPATGRGEGVLAHELAHVVQQRTGRVRNPFAAGLAIVQDPLLEAEADRMSRRFAAQPPAATPRTAQPSAATPRTAQPMSVVQGFFPRGLTAFTQSRGVPARPMPGGSAVQLSSRQFPPPSTAGQPLPPVVRQKMEAIFGTSFAGVRIHVGPQAQSIGALAFTQGSNIHFAPNRYAPDSLQGQQILAHELVHVIQQRAGRVRNPFGAGLAVVQNVMLDREVALFAARAAAFANARHGDIAQATLGSALWGGVRWGLGGLAVGAIGAALAPAAAVAAVGTGVVVGGAGGIGALYGLYRGSQETPATPAPRVRAATVAPRREQRRRPAISIAEEKRESPPEEEPEEVEDDGLGLLLSTFGSRYEDATPSSSTTTTSSSTTTTTTSIAKTLSAGEITTEADYLITSVENAGRAGNNSVYPSQGGIRIADKVRIAASLGRYHNRVNARWAGANVYYYIVWTRAGKIDITGHRWRGTTDVSRSAGTNEFNYHVQW